MFDEIRKFFSANDPKDEQKLIIDLWKDQEAYTWSILAEYVKYLDGFLNRKPGEKFKDRLDKLNRLELGQTTSKSSSQSQILEKEYLKVYKQIVSPAPSPTPHDPIEIQTHLEAVWFYFSLANRKIISQDISAALQMGFALTQLTRIATIIVLRIKNKWGFDKDRIQNNSTVQGKGRAERKQNTIEAFYKIPGRSRLSYADLHKKITDLLVEKGQKAPSIDRMKAYLREDGLIPPPQR